ncbi:hypothetical protein DN757_24740 [Paenibacillus silvae]|uniref:Uncharacterized protein n=1 Tax=Paenibacillus silvae TaxID=1325358 RepID=A0A2W6NZZ6_9BACL|nr:hypothetical protein DN757_24740 [Paenibacillus silvae]
MLLLVVLYHFVESENIVHSFIA